jgi:hypothetical protein
MKSEAVYRTDAGTWRIEKQSEVLYRVSSAGADAGRGAGYLERVGAVWVALAGSRLDICVEVGQSVDFDRAASLLIGQGDA